ncbi:hypothetical protein LCGC14_2699210 [marine sediment metagenome]|uniref:Uncharacterized protein n=1 Tax=marine sediment metagenome TaxID=412755 RepID=A0A0F9A3S9_9ZZZZ
MLCSGGHIWSMGRARPTKTNAAMSNIPCGRTLGHGENCCDGHLCDSCREIESLRAEPRTAFMAGHAAGYCDGDGVHCWPLDKESAEKAYKEWMLSLLNERVPTRLRQGRE